MDANVIKKIQADFPQSEWEDVEKALREYGTASHHAERDRVHFDILLLANGDLKEVKRLVKAGTQDYRDILYWAEYYDNDPWILWQQLLETLNNAHHLSQTETQHFLNAKGAGFWRDPSLASLEELCHLLVEKHVELSKDVFEQIRAYGKRWKAKASWKSLRKQIVKREKTKT